MPLPLFEDFSNAADDVIGDTLGPEFYSSDKDIKAKFKTAPVLGQAIAITSTSSVKPAAIPEFAKGGVALAWKGPQGFEVKKAEIKTGGKYKLDLKQDLKAILPGLRAQCVAKGPYEFKGAYESDKASAQVTYKTGAKGSAYVADLVVAPIKGLMAGCGITGLVNGAYSPVAALSYSMAPYSMFFSAGMYAEAELGKTEVPATFALKCLASPMPKLTVSAIVSNGTLSAEGAEASVGCQYKDGNFNVKAKVDTSSTMSAWVRYQALKATNIGFQCKQGKEFEYGFCASMG